jgi:hypothetical protein
MSSLITIESWALPKDNTDDKLKQGTFVWGAHMGTTVTFIVQ